jgi:hypothetical protein
MPPGDKGHSSITTSDQELVLSLLEPEQLAGLKKHVIPRRRLRGLTRFVVWSLRIYLLFMTVVVIYEVWTGVR